MSAGAGCVHKMSVSQCYYSIVYIVWNDRSDVGFQRKYYDLSAEENLLWYYLFRPMCLTLVQFLRLYGQLWLLIF